jgi:hypothetical protein
VGGARYVRAVGAGLLTVGVLTAAPALAEDPPIPFTAPQTYQVGSFEDGTAIGDVNGDGWQDALITTSFDFDPEKDHSLFVFYGRPDGTLEAQATQIRLPIDRNFPVTVITGDFTGDGLTDAFVTSYDGSFLLRQQDHALVLAQTFPVTYYVDHTFAQPADLDGDGYTDILLNTTANGALMLLQRDGRLLLSPLTPTFDDPLDGVEGLVADATGDGRPDVVTAFGGSVTEPGEVKVLPQLVDGRFGAPKGYPLPLESYIEAVGVGDLNADGRTDVVAVTDSLAVVMVQKADGTLTPYADAQRVPVNGYTDVVVVADANGDGLDDLVLGQDSTMIGILRQQPDGTLAAQQTVSMGSGTHVAYGGLSVGDISGDGLNDLVVSDYNSGLQVARNLGTPPPLDTAVLSGPRSLRPGAAIFGLAANRGGAGFECSLDGAEYSSCTSPVAYSGLQPGTDHVLHVRGVWNGETDATPAQHSFHVLKLLPSVSVATDRTQYRTGATMRIRVQVDGSETRRIRLTASRADGMTSVLFDGVLPVDGLTLDRTSSMTETYLAESLADARQDPAAATVRPTVHAALRIAASRPIARDGKYGIYPASADPVFRSRVVPTRANVCVLFQLQRRTAPRVWRTMRTSTCRRSGSLGVAHWTLTGRQRAGAAFRARSIFAGDALNGAATSSWIYLRFRR